MKKARNILLLFLFCTINLSGQVVYDTIPNNNISFGSQSWEELFVFKDFQSQSLTLFNAIKLNNINCIGKKIIIETTFGKDGKIKNTRIIKAANPICDSIAFYFINGLKDWLPGLGRGKFVDIQFVFPIVFDSTIHKNKISKNIFICEIEEYNKRKKIFDFVYSEQKDQEIINDYYFFKNYIAETFRTDQYVNIITDYRLYRKESIVLEFNPPKNKKTHLLVRDSQRNWILYEYNLKKRKIRLPKDKNLFLLFYEEGTNPLLQTMTFYSEKDTTINLKLEKYTKDRLLKEIEKYKK